MIVLGVDASLTRTGWAIVEVRTPHVPGTECVIATGAICTTKADGDDTTRQGNIAGSVVGIASARGAELIGLETPYVNRARADDTALRLAALGAAIRLWVRGIGIELVPVAPQSRAKALGVKPGLPRDEVKARVKAAVLSRYGLAVADDEADAIGVALAAAAKWQRQQRDAATRQLALPGTSRVRSTRRKAPTVTRE